MSDAQTPRAPYIAEAGPAAFGTATLFIAAIVFGSGLGLSAPDLGRALAQGMDATLLVMISLVLFELRFGAVLRAFGAFRFLAIAWGANFLLVPLIGLAIASVVMSGAPLLFAGVMIYMLAPCTDWVLGFTRMAGGDTELGAALIPVNLISQLALFPLWLWLFTPAAGLLTDQAALSVVVQWFVVPLVLAQICRVGLARILPAASFENVVSWTSSLLPWVLAALIVQIFAAHIGTILTRADVFASVAGAVVLFFATTALLGVAIGRAARLTHPRHVVLSMTLAARNAPLMLALTALAMPDQPLVLAVIVFGMLVEIPLLTGLTHILLRRRVTQHRAA